MAAGRGVTVPGSGVTVVSLRFFHQVAPFSWPMPAAPHILV